MIDGLCRAGMVENLPAFSVRREGAKVPPARARQFLNNEQPPTINFRGYASATFFRKLRMPVWAIISKLLVFVRYRKQPSVT